MKRGRDLDLDLDIDNQLTQFSQDLPSVAIDHQAVAKPIWEKIVLPLDMPSRLALRRTSSFFATDIKLRDSCFRSRIFENYLDTPEENELDKQIISHTTKPVLLAGGVEKYQEVVKFFNSQLKTVREELDKIKEENHFPLATESSFALKIKEVLFLACEQGSLAILKMLIESNLWETVYFSGQKMKNLTPLGYAAAYGKKHFFLLLFQASEQLPILSIKSVLMNFNFGYEMRSQMTCIHILALRSEEDCLLTILEQLSNSAKELFTANYHRALIHIINNHQEQLSELLEQDPSLLKAIDNAAWTLLHWASCLGKTQAMRILLNKGAATDPNDDSLPLYLACATGKLNAIKSLVIYKVIIKEDRNNNSCLHLTAYNGHSACVRYLIEECKLDMEAKNNQGHTPLSLARLGINSERHVSPAVWAGKTECVNLLLDLGARAYLDDLVYF